MTERPEYRTLSLTPTTHPLWVVVTSYHKAAVVVTPGVTKIPSAEVCTVIALALVEVTDNGDTCTDILPVVADYLNSDVVNERGLLVDMGRDVEWSTFTSYEDAREDAAETNKVGREMREEIVAFAKEVNREVNK